MKKIKSLLIMVMTVLLTFGLVSCGKDKDENKNNNKNTEYSITFMVDDRIYETIQTAGNEKLTFPENPTKEDYTFVGWYVDKDVWEKEITEDSFLNISLTGNMKLYARFIEEVKYTIIFMVDDDVYGTIKTAGNKKLQFPENPTKGNYIFSGWYLDKDVWEKEVTEDTYLKAPLTENITLYARFTVPTITFIVDDEIYETIETFGNEKLTFPENPTKGNYIFGGWYSDKNVWETEVTEDTYLSAPLTENIRVYAKFDKPTITFMIDDEVYDTIQTLGNEKLTFPENPTNGNYIFGGWYLDKDVWEKEVTENTYLSTPLTENIRVYAKFDKPTITFMVDDEVYNTIQTLGNEKLTFPENPTNGNYAFDGWYLDKDVWKKEITEDTFLNTPLTKSITVYARFTTPTITFIVDDEVYETIKTFGNEKLKFPKDPTKSYYNYIFGGWFLDKDVWETEVTEDTFLNTPLTENITVYAGFAPQLDIIDCINYWLSDRKYSVTDCYTSATSVTIKNEIIGIPVTEIGYEAFKGCSSLTSVTIGNSVTNIGYGAFKGCSNLTSIIIPNSVTEIKPWAFEDCSSLTNITIPDSVTEIGYEAFKGCSSLTSVTIGNGVTYIGDYAFDSCSNLTSVTIGNGVTYIADWAFDNCSSLKDVYYGGTTLDWCKIDFEHYSSTPMEYAEHFYIKNETGEFEEVTEIIIPDGITEIKDYAFYGFNNITKVEIPDSVTYIGYNAFEGCRSLIDVYYGGTIADWCKIDFGSWSSTPMYHAEHFYIKNESGEYEELTEIIIPNSVTSIGSGAFFGMDSLKNVYYEGTIADWCKIDFGDCASNPMYCAEHFYIKNESGEYEEVTEIIIPDGMTEIKEATFEGFDNITKVEIPITVTSIGDYAFHGCWQLTSITIPDSVTYIGDYAFCSLDSLGDITIPGNVTGIGERAFYSCDSLTSVTIENGVTSIGDEAFLFCSSLTSITIPDSVTRIGGDVFYDCDSLQFNQYDNALYLGNSENLYLVLIKPINKNITTCNINSNTKIIANRAFYNCTSLTSVIIPDSVTRIGDWAFYNCSSLTRVTIGNGVTGIGAFAFYDCSSLADVYYGGTIADWCNIDFEYEYDVNYLSSNPMYYAEHFYMKNKISEFEEVTEIIIPDGVTEIKAYAFYRFNNITKVEIPDSVTRIGDYAFDSCSSLTDVYYGGTIADWCKIDFESWAPNPMYYAEHFYMKNKISEFEEVTEIIIPDGVTEIKNYAFYRFNNITKVEIPITVTSIGDYAFCDCSSLTSIIIPDSVTRIGDWAFCDCSSLTRVTIGNGVTRIGEYAFYNCRSLTRVTIGNGVTDIGDYAFDGCWQLTSITIPDSVTYIGDYAFYNCRSLTDVYFENPNNWIAGNTPLSNSDLSNPKTAAEFLRSSYRDCEWKRN